MEKYNNRSEVPDKYKWDLTDFFKDEEELNKAFDECKELVDKVPEYSGHINDPEKLLELLQLIIKTNVLAENIYVYTYLINDQELGNSKSMQNKAKAENLCAKFEANLSYFNPELLSLSKEEYDNLFVKEPKLNDYKFMLDETYRNKEHVLTENEEKIITQLEMAANHFDDMSSTMLNSEHNYGEVEIDGKKEIITTTNRRSLMKNKNREIRKEISEKFNKILNQYANSSVQFLNSYVALNDTEAVIRKYKNAWDAKLFNLNMPNKAYDALVNTVEKNVSSLQDYFRLYKDEVGIDELHQYDLSLDMNKCDKKYTIEEAQELILEALKPLGEDYLKHFRKVFDNHYIDYCTYKGKCSGGYSFATIDHDSRILLSFNGDLEDVSTIAHEGGHNVHHQFVSENNPEQYRNISSLVCEVASLTNECLLSSYLANNGTTKEEKLAGIENILGVILSNLFGAVREGKIEQDMYKEYEENGSITKEFMDKTVIDSLNKYYGDTIKLDENSNTSWIIRSHYYMNYYLYSYAFCISVASFVAKHILDGDTEMLNKYIDFLSTGEDTWPIDTFKKLGVDLTEEKVYEDAIQYFNEMLNKYKEIRES